MQQADTTLIKAAVCKQDWFQWLILLCLQIAVHSLLSCLSYKMPYPIYTILLHTELLCSLHVLGLD